MKALLVFIAILSLGFIMAQPPVAWEMEKSSFLIHVNYGASLVTDPQGNIYCAGQLYESASLGNTMLMKLDPQGNELWMKLWKGAGADGENKLNKVVRARSGALYAVGQFTDRDGDIAVMKYTPSGDLRWYDNYSASSFGNYNDEGFDIAVDAEENVYVVGVVTSTSGNGDDVMTIAYDSMGAILWEKQYTGASDWDFPSAICADASGNVYSTSGSFNFFGTASRDMTILHYDKQGTEQWKAYYTGPSGHDYSKDIQTDGNGHVWVCGQINTNNYDMGIARFNEFGTKLWSKTYDGSAGQGDTAISLALHTDGSVTVIGKTMEDLNGNIVPAMTIIHYDGQGNEVWNKQMFGPEDLGIEPNRVYVDTTNDIIYAAGTTQRSNNQTDGFLIRLNKAGAIQWTYTHDGSKFMDDAFMDVTTDRFGNVIASGYANSDGTSADVLIVKLGNNGPTGLKQEITDLSVTVYPNPLTDQLSITGGQLSYTLMTADHRTVATGQIEGHGAIEVVDYPKGLYILFLKDKKGHQAVRKLIKM